MSRELEPLDPALRARWDNISLGDTISYTVDGGSAPRAGRVVGFHSNPSDGFRRVVHTVLVDGRTAVPLHRIISRTRNGVRMEF